MWTLYDPAGQPVPLGDLSVSVQTDGGDMPTSDAPPTLTLHLTPRQRSTVPALHDMLTRALNPQRATTATPAALHYAGRTRTLRLPVVYAGGLAGDGTGDAPLALTLHTCAATWAAATASTTDLPTATGLPAGYLYYRDAAGGWHTAPGGTANGGINALLATPDGTCSIAGGFLPYVLHYQPAAAPADQWQPLPGLNGEATCLARAADGTLYAGGYFDSPALFVARYHTASATWQPLGTPAVLPFALHHLPDGRLVAGGGAAVVGNEHYTQYWDGQQWQGMGNPGGVVNALHHNGTVLLAGGDLPGGVVWWDGLATWYPLGEGLHNSDGSTPTVNALLPLPDGRIVAGGSFDRAGALPAAGLAIWDGYRWQSPGAGLDDTVTALAALPDGGVLVGGAFAYAGETYVTSGLAHWSGSAWLPLPVQRTHPGSATAVATLPDGSVLVGYRSSSDGYAANTTTVVQGGSAAARPWLTLAGPARLYHLANHTTGAVLACDVRLLAGETLTLDLRPPQPTLTSDTRGTLLGGLVPGSVLGQWHLLPGANAVSLLARDALAPARLHWHAAYWHHTGGDL